jgi:nicotinate-nucleotide--dimethylbenzimidazole phosphoribosyltransferase
VNFSPSAIPAAKTDIADRVQRRLDSLTKPPGSLGRLEEIALRLAVIQATTEPRAARRLIVIMAGDHGICSEGVSAYPAAVTAQMLLNFARGGAAINVLARHAAAEVQVVNMGVLEPVEITGVLNRCIAPGTQNFLRGRAMTIAEAERAIATGMQLAHSAADRGIEIVAGGDMGIGNTTSSSVIAALATGAAPALVVGRGTGIADAMLARKLAVVTEAVALHNKFSDGVDLLSRVGGFEIAGLTGLMLGAAERRIPIVLDGFIATAAALAAAVISPAARDCMIAAHCSAEPGHRVALDHLGLRPLLEWHMRLGEGTGAALVFPLLEAACRILAEMATFESAGVSGRLE